MLAGGETLVVEIEASCLWQLHMVNPSMLEMAAIVVTGLVPRTGTAASGTSVHVAQHGNS